MTFEDLKRIFPNATLETWHQHPNGGGWVENTATVEDTAYVGPDALVYDWAQVYDQAEIYDNAKVSGHAKVYGWAEIYGHAHVYGWGHVYDWGHVYGQAQVYGGGRVYDYAGVCGLARIHGTARVCEYADVGFAGVHDGTWLESPLTLAGTQHPLCVCSPTEIAIGCEVHSVDHWLEQYEEIGKANGYTDEDIAEYRYLIDVAAEWMRVRMPGCLEETT